MTLLVRDEEDIVESNICFHLNQGVDKILVIDNGSVDGTTDILNKYKKTGVLEYKIIKEHTYEQDKWVSGMAKEAILRHKASHVLHCDADEFWLPNSGTIKDVIAKNQTKDVIFVRVINYLPPQDKKVEGLNFSNFNYIITKTTLVPGYVKDRISSKVFFYTYPNKVITNNKITEIGYGNDTVKSEEEIESLVTDDIFIHHFPVRNWKHFERKVVNGGSSYKNNSIKDPSIGWHWKKWFLLYEKGLLEEEYHRLALSDNLESQITEGVVELSPVPKRIRYAKELFLLNKYFHFKISCPKLLQKRS